MKHHYVPQFLLRRWTSATGKLRIYSVRNGRLVGTDRAPEYTGYENGLYAVIAHALGFSKDVIEKKLFGPIDNDAARVLEKLEAHESISEEQHIAWTFFLSSLRIRQPDTLDFLRTDGAELRTKILAELDEATLPKGWPTTQQWFDRHFPGALEANSLITWLPRMIAQPDVMTAFGGLNWWFREFEPDEPKLLLSDLPIHWEGGLNEAGFMIQLPISPHRLFFGTRSERSELFLTQLPAGELIRRVNFTTLASSSERIWASPDDTGAHAFIEANREMMGVNVVPFRSLRKTAAPKASR